MKTARVGDQTTEKGEDEYEASAPLGWFSSRQPHLVGETPQDGSAQENALGPEGQSLQHVVAGSDPTVHVHFHAAFHGGHHFWQGIDLKSRDTCGSTLRASRERGVPSPWVGTRKPKQGPRLTVPSPPLLCLRLLAPVEAVQPAPEARGLSVAAPSAISRSDGGQLLPGSLVRMSTSRKELLVPLRILKGTFSTSSVCFCSASRKQEE